MEQIWWNTRGGGYSLNWAIFKATLEDSQKWILFVYKQKFVGAYKKETIEESIFKHCGIIFFLEESSRRLVSNWTTRHFTGVEPCPSSETQGWSIGSEKIQGRYFKNCTFRDWLPLGFREWALSDVVKQKLNVQETYTDHFEVYTIKESDFVFLVKPVLLHHLFLFCRCQWCG